MNDIQKCNLENIFKDIRAELECETNKKSAFYNFNFEEEVPIESSKPRFSWRTEKFPAFQLIDFALHSTENNSTHRHQALH